MNKKVLTLFFFLQLIFSLFLAADTAKTIENKALTPILTPSFSERETVKLQLKNGLQAYLISDPHADQSSAALVVKTGCWNDPEEHPGMAHFLEHMLFLGNKKYPEESGYDHFMTQHGGKFNAFTTNDFTGYVFTIAHDALPEALDRFSHFFKEPLFNPSGVDRELQAIDQEYAKNVENDEIRSYYIHKEISNPGHPHCAFSMGNKESLQKISQEALKKWHQTHYSADKMVVEVISNLSLERLTALVINDFSSVPNTGFSGCAPSQPVISDSLKGHMVYIEPLKQLQRLTLVWELPFKFAHMRDTKPDLPICHVLGHEGKNSLTDTLKNEKLIQSLQCSTEKFGGNSYALALQIDLTDAGVKNVDLVILRCFEALAMLKQKGIPSYIIDELQTISQMDYQYQQRQDAFEHILHEAMLLADEGLETYPEQSKMVQQSDLEATKELLQFLTPKNCLFELIAPSLATGVPFENKEKWLGAAYTIKPIPEEKLLAWTDAPPSFKIDLPELNPYLPKNTEVYSPLTSQAQAPSSIPVPTTLIENENGKIYFAPDTHYAVPTVSWTFEIKTPIIDPTDAESQVLADLFVKYANEALNTDLYPAYMAGLRFSLQKASSSIFITVNGYSCKSQIFFLDMVNSLKKLQPREKKFKTYKEVLLRSYQNEAQDSPLKQAYEIFHSVLYKNYFQNKEKITAIRKISFEKFQDFCSRLFEKTFVEGIMYGNMKEAQALEAATHLMSALSGKPYPKDEQPKEEVIVLPQDKGPFFIEVKSKVQGNAAILALAMDEFSFREKAAQQVLMQALKEPFFSTLRTKQQTGYLVISKPEDYEQHLFNLFAIQSNTHEPRDLLARFELFLESFLQELEKCEGMEKQFENIKKALLENAKKTPKSMSEMSLLLFKLAFSFNGDFDRIKKLTQAFEELSYEDFLETAYRTLGKENKHRFAILFSGSIPDGNIKYQKLCNPEKLKQLSTYQAAISEEDND